MTNWKSIVVWKNTFYKRINRHRNHPNPFQHIDINELNLPLTPIMHTQGCLVCEFRFFNKVFRNPVILLWLALGYQFFGIKWNSLTTWASLPNWDTVQTFQIPLFEGTLALCFSLQFSLTLKNTCHYRFLQRLPLYDVGLLFQQTSLFPLTSS